MSLRRFNQGRGGKSDIIISAMLDFQTIVFYVFSITLMGSAVSVISVRNTVYSALFLVLAFLSSAGLWMLLQAEFLAIVLVLVYVGAVMVLFLFVLMMLDVNYERLRGGGRHYWLFVTVAAVLVAVQISWVFNADEFADTTRYAEIAQTANNTRQLGAVLYTDYVYPFELASVLLLLAIVAAVALTLRRRKGSKYIAPSRTGAGEKFRAHKIGFHDGCERNRAIDGSGAGQRRR